MVIQMKIKRDDPVLDTFDTLANIPKEDHWIEIFNTNCACLRNAPEGLTPNQYAQLVVDYFNETLKVGESPRALIYANEIGLISDPSWRIM